jgi:hypothetical protein
VQYSYTFALNPFPCLETLVGDTIGVMSNLGVDTTDAQYWATGETMQSCVDSFIASAHAYTEMYLTSSLYEINPIYDTDTWMEGAEMYFVIFYTYFGLMWIHSSYANYELPI